MRQVGVVRRIDDLGRVAIPKEIRRILGFQEGDPVEIFVDSENKEVTLKPYKIVDYRKLWEELKRDSSLKVKMMELEEEYKNKYL
ncbi:AbrB family looped-hinge helix DNA binding protein [Halalkalibacter oceani]